MNDTATSASGASLVPTTTDAFTAAHLAIIAVLVVLVLIGILYGMKLARRRHHAEHEIDAHNADIEGTPAEPARETPTIARAAPPVAPAPPPATDDLAPGLPEPLASEPIPAAAAFDASPASEAAAPAPDATGASADGPITQLKGLGPKVAARLSELGITTVGQLAALDDDAAARLDDDLDAFKGRLTRDRWLEQARLLAAGDKAGFEQAFGRL